MVSEDIIGRRDAYIRLMRDYGRMSPDAVIAGVSETQRRLLATLRSATEDQATIKPAPGEWCLRQLAMHAAFTERLTAQLIHHLARSSMPPREAFAGAGIGMMPADDGRSYGDVLVDLEQRNGDLLEAVRMLPDEPDRARTLPHPFFGPLNCLEWAGFQRVHDTDHLQHARRIIAVTKT